MPKWQSAVLRFRSIEPLLSIPRRYHVQSCRNRRYALAASQASGSFPPHCGCCISPCGGCTHACEQSGSHDEEQDGPIWSKVKFFGVKLALSCWVPATAWPRMVAQSAENQKAEAKFDGSFGCISEKDPAECWTSWITFPCFCPNEFFPMEPFAKNLGASCDIFQKQDLSNPFLTVPSETGPEMESLASSDSGTWAPWLQAFTGKEGRWQRWTPSRCSRKAGPEFVPDPPNPIWWDKSCTMTGKAQWSPGPKAFP